MHSQKSLGSSTSRQGALQHPHPPHLPPVFFVFTFGFGVLLITMSTVSEHLISFSGKLGAATQVCLFVFSKTNC